jgi:pyruvate kinase
MVQSGMDIARINTKYGSIRQYEEMMHRVRAAGGMIMFDIKGNSMLKWIKTQNPDYVAVSFAETERQINKIRKILNNPLVKIIAKIETRKGFNNLAKLVKAGDGIMIARGDLGRHIPFYQLPIFQKKIIRTCNRNKEFVITATEMLLSMTKNKIPERAEVSDVANAVLDGTNAVMLSEETAIGVHPVLVVKTMNDIVRFTERNKVSFS